MAAGATLVAFVVLVAASFDRWWGPQLQHPHQMVPAVQTRCGFWQHNFP